AVVPALADPVAQLAHRRQRRIEHDRRGLGDRIGVDARHTWATNEDRFDACLLARPLHAPDVEDDCLAHQSEMSACAMTRVGVIRTRSSPGTAFRAPNSSARSAPMYRAPTAVAHRWSSSRSSDSVAPPSTTT